MWNRNECFFSGRIAREPKIYKDLKTKKQFLSFAIHNTIEFSPVAKRRQLINVRGYGYYVDYLKYLKKGDSVDVAGHIVVRSEKLKNGSQGQISKRQYTSGTIAYLHLKQLWDYSEFNRIHAALKENFKKPKHFFHLMEMELSKRNLDPEDFDSMEKFLPDFLKKEWQKRLKDKDKNKTDRWS